MRAGARHFIHAAVPLSPATERRSCAFSRSPEPATRVHEPMEPSAATPKRRLSASAAEVYPKARRSLQDTSPKGSLDARPARKASPSVPRFFPPAGAADEEASHVVPSSVAAAVLSESPPPSPRAEYTEAPPSPRPRADAPAYAYPYERKESPRYEPTGYEPTGFEDEPRDMAERLGWRPTGYYGAGSPSPSPPPPSPRADELAYAYAGGPQDPTYKTRLCVYPLGECPHGALCKFAHGQAELRPSPAATTATYKTRPCRYTLAECPFAAAGRCQFAHSLDELRQGPPNLAPDSRLSAKFYKTKMCRYGETCPYRDEGRCQYAHSRDELRCRRAAVVGSTSLPAVTPTAAEASDLLEYDTAPQAWPPPRTPQRRLTPPAADATTFGLARHYDEIARRRFTKICKYFLAGHCPFEAEGKCQFASTRAEIRRADPSRPPPRHRRAERATHKIDAGTLDARAPHPAQARAPGRPAAPAHHQAFTAGHAADAGSQRTLAGDGRAARVHAAPPARHRRARRGLGPRGLRPQRDLRPLRRRRGRVRGAVRGLTD